MNGPRGISRPEGARPVSVNSRFQVGTVHKGRALKYFFRGVRMEGDLPLGVYVDFGGPRWGIIFDRGRLGLKTGEIINVKIVKVSQGRGGMPLFDLEFVEKGADADKKAEITDAGPFYIIPRALLDSPEIEEHKNLDGLIPAALYAYASDKSVVEENRGFEEKGVEVTNYIDQRQYRFLAPEIIWQTVEALAKGERVAMQIGKYNLAARKRSAVLAAIPGYSIAPIDIPGYIPVHEGGIWEVFLRDYHKSSFEAVAKAMAEGTLILSIVPKPQKGFVCRITEDSPVSAWRVRIPYHFEGKEYGHYYLLPEYFSRNYNNGDEIEIVLIGEYGSRQDRDWQTVCAPVRELKQLEQAIEALRRGAEAEIVETDFQSNYSSHVQIRIGELAFPAQIIFGNAPERVFSVGQKVRLTLGAEIMDKPFRGNEFFYVKMLTRYTDRVPLALAA